MFCTLGIGGVKQLFRSPDGTSILQIYRTGEVSEQNRLKEVKILFLGASKRVTLLERFFAAAEQLAISVRLYSCEATAEFYPISHLASVIAGPDFMTPAFQIWLEKTIQEYTIDIIIPNLDAATVALSKYRYEHRENQCWALVSDHDICWKMYDKLLSDRFFRSVGVLCPDNTPGHFPKILKPRFGSASKGLQVACSESQMARILNENDIDYFVQDFISKVRETTVDFYISRKGELIGYVLRDRIEVSDGEVMVCRTRTPDLEEIELIEQLAKSAPWQGCITLQYINSGQQLYVIEINPRFGGGATCGIEAGLNMPLYVLAEFFGYDINPPVVNHKLLMTRARRDFFYEYV